MTSDIWKLSAVDIAAGVRAGTFTAVEATQSALQRLEAMPSSTTTPSDRWHAPPRSTP
jgi:Asp-tRNA(Asn)/Glu-tRNA(Gln) amidotransferase A subunit family amidase